MCALREEKQIPNLRATERTRLLRPNSRISWKKRARNMMHENHNRKWFERRKMVAKTKGHSGADHLRAKKRGEVAKKRKARGGLLLARKARALVGADDGSDDDDPEEATPKGVA